MNSFSKALLGGTAMAAAMGGLLAPVQEANAQQQPGTYTTQTAYRPDAATFTQMIAGGRTTCSTTQDTVANLTITISPPAGQYVYLTGVYFEGLANATGATSTTVWSSTNLTGSPAWLTPTTASAAANPTGMINLSEIYPTGLKSTAAGTNVTIVPQATTASAFLCAKAVGYFSPQ